MVEFTPEQLAEFFNNRTPEQIRDILNSLAGSSGTFADAMGTILSKSTEGLNKVKEIALDAKKSVTELFDNINPESLDGLIRQASIAHPKMTSLLAQAGQLFLVISRRLPT